MSRFDTFAATVGVLLLENLACLAWKAPLPPALAGARGWYLPTADLPQVLMIAPADGLDDTAIATLLGQWQTWLESIHAGDAVLLLAWADGLPAGRELEPLPGEARWLVWPLDLTAPEPAEPDIAEGRELVDQTFDGVAAYFQGVRHSLEDLEDGERGNLEGKPPFSIFLKEQHAPGTWVLLALLAAFYGLEWALGGTTNYRMLRAGAINAPLVNHGEVWRLVSAIFLHFNMVHLGVNALSLFAVGPFLEKLFGTMKFLGIYLFAGLTGAIASYWFNRNGISAGASGALSGLLGAMLVLGLFHRGAMPAYQMRSLRQAGLLMLALTIGLGLAIPHIDNSAHMGGLAGGALLAVLAGPHPLLLRRRVSPWLRRGLYLVFALFAAGLVASLAYTLSGRVPEMETEAPTGDFVARVPLDLIQFNGKALDVSADHDQHWVRLESLENWAGQATPARQALTEATLGAHADLLASRYATLGAKLADKPRVVHSGRHRFLRIPLALPDGSHEEVYVTASPQRIYAVRTYGLETRPWVRPMLERALATFEMKVPRSEP
jgi:membrane associated rhomboid family serine protease